MNYSSCKNIVSVVNIRVSKVWKKCLIYSWSRKTKFLSSLSHLDFRPSY